MAAPANLATHAPPNCGLGCRVRAAITLNPQTHKPGHPRPAALPPPAAVSRTAHDKAFDCPPRNCRYGRDIGIPVMMNFVMVLVR